MESELESCKPMASEVSRTPEKTPESVDSALTFLHDVDRTTFTADEERRLVRKIDWLLMPLLGLVYFLQFLDKNLSMLILVRACVTRLQR